MKPTVLMMIIMPNF